MTIHEEEAHEMDQPRRIPSAFTARSIHIHLAFRNITTLVFLHYLGT